MVHDSDDERVGDAEQRTSTTAPGCRRPWSSLGSRTRDAAPAEAATPRTTRPTPMHDRDPRRGGPAAARELGDDQAHEAEHGHEAGGHDRRPTAERARSGDRPASVPAARSALEPAGSRQVGRQHGEPAGVDGRHHAGAEGNASGASLISSSSSTTSAAARRRRSVGSMSTLTIVPLGVDERGGRHGRHRRRPGAARRGGRARGRR